MSTFFRTLTWSVPFWPEWITDGNNPIDGLPNSVNLNTDGGDITALGFVQNYFYVFLNRAYFVYGYTGGIDPLEDIRRVSHGCNFDRNMSICEVNGSEYLAYSSDDGHIRLTNGPTYDTPLTSNIRSIAQGVHAGRDANDYYTTYPNACPTLCYDKTLQMLRLFYAGTSSNSDKVLTYHFNKSSWTEGQYNANSAIAVSGIDPTYSMIIGPSDGSGKTYGLTQTISSDKALNLDTGWISPAPDNKRVKLYNVTVWAHAHAGCNTTLSFAFYNNPTTTTLVKTETRTLTYNNDVDNLQRIFVNAVVSGPMVRCVITDDGTSANYAIDRVEIDVEDLKASN
jgi:hypothetical protein